MREDLDINLTNCYTATKKSNWKLSDDSYASDHNYISFHIRSSNLKQTYKNPRNTVWVIFHKKLSHRLCITGSYLRHGIDRIIKSLNRAINDFHQKTCPENTEKTTKRLLDRILLGALTPKGFGSPPDEHHGYYTQGIWYPYGLSGKDISDFNLHTLTKFPYNTEYSPKREQS